MDETGWLIECNIDGIPSWFGYSLGEPVWTFDTGKAIRFSRKEDAQCMYDILKVRGVIHERTEAQAVEHMWCGVRGKHQLTLDLAEEDE